MPSTWKTINIRIQIRNKQYQTDDTIANMNKVLGWRTEKWTEYSKRHWKIFPKHNVDTVCRERNPDCEAWIEVWSVVPWLAPVVGGSIWIAAAGNRTPHASLFWAMVSRSCTGCPAFDICKPVLSLATTVLTTLPSTLVWCSCSPMLRWGNKGIIIRYNRTSENIPENWNTLSVSISNCLHH